ncbi:ferric reductase-like transmembrane domain-containing protein [Heyndrickxia acidicola]|uniref:Ferric reductase-like transmembrane domain-containing protein n=1 Tax=Heyndrickxia acidicola TaxID=209389 RepID=A0ABU6MIU1_9BACI|nr:ferric reductase-like transmembrane domain-containing protein [Heyndrickxia acidicola]MED1204581.1 ferric reductase-like transmembrane domain-containing protein [Heyndrickxia acidicola]
MSQYLQLFDTWHIIRLLGFLGYFFFSMSLAFGILSRMSVFKKKKGFFNLIHMSASWAGLFSVLGHVLVLLIDHYQPYTILEIIVPFAARYQTVASALGTIAFFIFVIVLFTSDVLITKMKKSTWKWIHLWVFPSWILMLFHGVFIGTDSSTRWGAWVYGASAAIIVLLFVVKAMDRGQRKTNEMGMRARR